MSVQKRLWEEQQQKMCGHVYELEECSFQDDRRPGDICTDDADEACLHHMCATHCKDPECLAHPDEDEDDE